MLVVFVLFALCSGLPGVILLPVLAQAPHESEAIRSAKQKLGTKEKELGPEHPDVAKSLRELAELHLKEPRPTSALPLLERALKILEKSIGADHQDIAAVLDQLGLLYASRPEQTMAEPPLDRIVTTYEKTGHTERRTTIYTREGHPAVVESDLHDDAKAQSLFERALAIREKVSGPDHSETAVVVQHLAEHCQAKGEHAKAETLWRRALAIYEKTLGPEHEQLAPMLHNLASVYDAMNEFTKAEPLYQRALKIWEKVLGPEHARVGRALNNLATRYQQAENYPQAEICYERTVRIMEKTAGPDHADTAVVLNNQATMYEAKGDAKKAEPLYQRVLEIREKSLGAEHADTASVLCNLAWLAETKDDQKNAELLLQRALKIREKAVGSEHQDTADTLNSLATLYEAMDNHKKAEPLYQRVLKIREKVLGPEHADTIMVLEKLARVYMRMGAYAKAEPHCQRALQSREKVLGPEHPDTARNLFHLTVLYVAMGEYGKAESMSRHALTSRERTYGPEHLYTSRCLMVLAMVYEVMGECGKAEPLFQRALKIIETVHEPEHLDTASGLESLGRIFDLFGAYARAELLYQHALKIREKALGPDHPDTADTLDHLAWLYKEMGDYANAERLYQRALKIREQVLGPEHADTATSLTNLARLYDAMCEYAKAELLLQRALRINEKVRGPEHADTVRSLNDQAALYDNMGDYAKAEPLLQRALKISEQVFGPDHANTALGLSALAGHYEKMGDFVKVEPLIRRALQISEKVFGPEHPDTANSLRILALLYKNMGEYAKSVTALQRVLSIEEKDHGGPDLSYTEYYKAESLAQLGLLFIKTGEHSKALEVASKLEQAQLKNLAQVFSFTSERQRLAHRKSFEAFELFAALGQAQELARAVLHYKGVVLDSLLEDRLVVNASRNAEDRSSVEHLRAAKRRLTQLLFEVPADLSPEARQERESEGNKLANEVEELEKTLARKVAGLGLARRALSVTVEQVQRAIPRQAVLLELLRYGGYYSGTNKIGPHYGAIVLARSGGPEWVPLGSADAIDNTVMAYQTAVRRPGEQSQFSTLLQALHQQLWAPIEAALPKGTKTVIISPDGALNFVSYATLITPEDKFLSQKYSIQYVSSGRDLLKEKKRLPIKRVAIYANPDFAGRAGAGVSSPVGTDGLPKPRESVAQEGRSLRESRSTPSLTNSAAVGGKEVRDAVERVLTEPGAEFGGLRYLDRRDLQGLTLPPLPGTAQESALLVERAKRWNWPANVFVGAEASEAQLQALNSPRILHLATHGFFLPDVEVERKKGLMDGWTSGSMDEARGIGGVRPQLGSFGASNPILRPPVALKNPMHRSGLALAGAQTTLEAWKRGETPPANNDGIVTADEVGTLKLEGTELVVLSACDTGMGEAKSGEGVLGLRRGFIQAGAQNLLMTLWSVADEETVKLMADFYERFHATGNAPRALAEVQRDWLVNLRKERGLQAAVTLAGPFILSSQGAP